MKVVKNINLAVIEQKTIFARNTAQNVKRLINQESEISVCEDLWAMK